MNDIILRGIVLQKFYEKRLEGFVEINEFDFEEQLSKHEIVYISEQLATYNFIDWQPYYNDGTLVRCSGKIRSSGIDVILRGGIKAPIEIKIDNSHYYINLHDMGMDVQKLMNAIERSNASEYEIRKAKLKLIEFLNLPLIKKRLVNPSLPEIENQNKFESQ